MLRCTAVCVFVSSVVSACASCGVDEPDYPDTFVAADLRLCVSTTHVPDNLHRNLRDAVSEHGFAGVVRHAGTDDGVHFPYVLATCKDSSAARFIVEDE